MTIQNKKIFFIKVCMYKYWKNHVVAPNVITKVIPSMHLVHLHHKRLKCKNKRTHGRDVMQTIFCRTIHKTKNVTDMKKFCHARERGDQKRCIHQTTTDVVPNCIQHQITLERTNKFRLQHIHFFGIFSSSWGILGVK